MANMIDNGFFYTSTDGRYMPYLLGSFLKEHKKNNLPERYILNKNACVCFWKNGTKTLSIRHKEDIFDKEIGFLMCCFQHYNADLSRNKRKKILSWIKTEHIKEYLFDMFVEKNKMTVNEAKAYLRDLKVESSKKQIATKEKPKHMKEDK